MERLGTLDAAFLEAEDADRHTSMAIASIAVFDGTPPKQDELLAAVTERLPLLPRYRQRVRRLPFDLSAPVWVDDPDFDLTFHIRRTALAAPGGDRELFALMSRVMAQRLDRDRPLWEMWVIEGLRGGRWALISKVHHCMVDGVSGTEIYHLLMSTTPDWRPSSTITAPAPVAGPSWARVALASAYDVALAPWRPIELIAAGLRHPRTAARYARDLIHGLLTMSGVLWPARSSVLLGRVGSQRSWAAVGVPLAQVKAISHALDVTVNDVALAVVSGGFRAVLQASGADCSRVTVRSLVPVSVRAPGTEQEFANRVSCMFADLPVHLSDPLDRLHDVHEQLRRAKEGKEAEAGEMLVELTAYGPFGLVAGFVRNAFRVPQHSLVTVTTNVPGPRAPLYLMGRRMLRMLPYVPIADGVRNGVAILSYCDELAFGVTSDRDAGIDGERMLRAVRRDVQALARIAAARTRAGGPAAAS